MRGEDREEIVARYEARLVQSTSQQAILATAPQARQETRFALLAQLGELHGTRILDLGCGLGDFYAYLCAQGIEVDYTGIDITPGLLERARARFPTAKHPNARFVLCDIQENPPQERFDYALCSQVFNNRLRHDDNVELVCDIMQRLYALCDRGVAIDMMTNFVDFEEERLYYYDPMLMFKHAKNITRRVTLRHDTPLFEFCLFLYPDFVAWGKSDA